MLCEYPIQNDKWNRHLASRIADACEIGLLSSAAVDEFETISIFLNDEVICSDIESHGPEQSLGSVINKTKIKKGWVKREDYFNKIAEWIHDEYCSDEQLLLVCEAGYSKEGDKSLQSRKYFIHNNKPFFVQKIHESNCDEIEKTLRLSRSWRLLGVVTRALTLEQDILVDSAPEIFLCDAFDLDTVVIGRTKLKGSKPFSGK